jgi:hypothetical protein
MKADLLKHHHQRLPNGGLVEMKRVWLFSVGPLLYL